MNAGPIQRTQQATPKGWLALACVLGALLIANGAGASETVALHPSQAGTLYLDAHTGGDPVSFLLDTGAGISSVTRDQLIALTGDKHPRPVREIGARLANGKIELLEVFEIDHFHVGRCDIGTIEVAVAKRGGRNLLGLGALRAAGPFAIEFATPSLTLERCQGAAVLAGNP